MAIIAMTTGMGRPVVRLWYRSNTGTRERRRFGMPDENLPETSEIPAMAPGRHGAGQGQANTVEDSVRDAEQTNPMTAMPPPIPAPPGQSSAEIPQRIPYWLQQAERLLRVIVRIYIGLVVCCVPWIPLFWDNNPLFTSSPWLLDFVTQGAVRGVVSGLGLLNLWIAFRDARRQPADSGSR